MPLIYGPTEMTNPQPKNFVTPSRTTGIYVQNVSPLALIITSGLGSIELPPWQTATLEMMPNDNMNVSAIPITAVPPALAAYAYVDISYTFQGVTVQGSGLFFPFMTPSGDAVAAGIMGPDGLQVGTSTSNPNNSSLLTQLTGRSATELYHATTGTIGAGALVNLSGTIDVSAYAAAWGFMGLSAVATANVTMYLMPIDNEGDYQAGYQLAQVVSGASTNSSPSPANVANTKGAVYVYNAQTASATISSITLTGRPN